MSIASTQLGMGYVAYTRSEATCAACAKSQEPANATASVHAGFPGGLRCLSGHFYVARQGTCNRFTAQQSSAPASITTGDCQ